MTRIDARDEIEQVYREHAPRLWRSLLLHTGRPEVASDATAEEFAQALRRWGELRDPLAWVWRAAFRIAAGEMSAARRTVEVRTDFSYEMTESIDDLLDELDTLSQHQRSCLILHYYAGYSYREIAGMLGSSTAAVGVHIHRAKRKLRGIMEDRDDGST